MNTKHLFMKKFFLSTLLLFGFVIMGYSQDISKNALGLRLGDSDGFGAEISYQTRLSDANRLEFDLGWRDGKNYSAYKLVGLYQWVMPLEGNFNWYVGAGAGLGSWSWEDGYTGTSDDGVFALLAGDIGIEYNFDIPLLISLDFRPELGLSDFHDDLDFDIALGLRYQF
jgi:opacity protein-like surface antigen